MFQVQVPLFEEDGEEAPIPVEEKPNLKVTYEDFEFDKLNIYAGIDCIATTGLAANVWEELNREETMRVPDEKGREKRVWALPIIESVCAIEMPSHEFVIDLEINGLGYSKDRNAFFDKKMREEVAALDEAIFSAIGVSLDMNSGPSIAKYLYEVRGLTPPFMTKGGEPATDGAALLTLAGLDPIGGKFITKDPELQWLATMAKRRDISSCHNTFIRTYYRDWVKYDGRIHPSYNLFGTSSFRITGSDPNLTQLPRAKHGYNVRCCYTTAPGYVFISFDFSSAEVKILANMAKEPAMLKAIQDGLDFHTFSASAMRGIPYEVIAGVLADQSHALYKEYKELRQLAKVLK